MKGQPALLVALLVAPGVGASPADHSTRPPWCCCGLAPPASARPPAGEGAAAFRSSKSLKYGLLGAALGAGTGLALGYDANPASPSSSLQGRPVFDVSAFALGAAGLVLPKALEGEAAKAGPGRWSDCRCEANDPPGACTDGLNGFDRAVRKAFVAGDVRRRQFWSDFSDLTLASGLTRPLALILAAERDTGERGRALLVYAESEAVAMGLNGIAKHFFHRPRPYAHFGEPPAPGALAREDSRLSFFSGHTTASFAATVAAGRLADLRGYRNRGWIWGSGLGVALASSAARIAADRHYATDVLVGMAVGSACGWAIPKIHERSLRQEARATPAVPVLAGPFASPGPALAMNGRVFGKNAGFGLGPWADGLGALIRLGW